VWGYPVVPLLFVVATFLILGNALREHPVGTGLAFGGILLGVPVYLAAFGSRGSGAAKRARL
jgi:hypothetical protein